MKTKIIILILTTFLLTTCRKYEEGGSYFLTDMTQKITGEYNFTHYYIDGVDSVDYYFNNYKKGRISINWLKQTTDYPFILDNYLYKNEYYRFAGQWRWNNKNKKTLIFNTEYIYKITSSVPYLEADSISFSFPFVKNNNTIWQILKLKDNDLVLETDYNSKHYRLELKK